MSRTPLSLVVTTRDNAATLATCLQSAAFADETLVLDSHSDDATRDIAGAAGAVIHVERFRGYGPQKARAVQLAAHDWVLLLDADEALSEPLAREIEALMRRGPEAAGYRLRREEWLYWRWPAPGTRLTDHLRLFDRRRMTMGEHPAHAAPRVDGPAPLLRGRLRHHGHRDLAGHLARLDHYTTLAAPTAPPSRLRLLLSPVAAFWREYLLRRQFLNGWAGFLAARMASTHAFLRHAKRLEAARRPGPGGDPQGGD